MTEIIVSLSFLVIGLLLTIHWQRKEENRLKKEVDKKRTELDRLRNFDEADIY